MKRKKGVLVNGDKNEVICYFIQSLEIDFQILTTKNDNKVYFLKLNNNNNNKISIKMYIDFLSILKFTKLTCLRRFSRISIILVTYDPIIYLSTFIVLYLNHCLIYILNIKLDLAYVNKILHKIVIMQQN